jgi:hypothetical protein
MQSGAPLCAPALFPRQETSLVVYATTEGGACMTECDGDQGAIFAFGANVATIKGAIAAVAGEINEE